MQDVNCLVREGAFRVEHAPDVSMPQHTCTRFQSLLPLYYLCHDEDSTAGFGV